MVIELYRDSPEYQYKEAKYIWYEQLFMGEENQESRVVIELSNGFALHEAPEELPNTPMPKNSFTVNYYLDNKPVYAIHKAVLTLSGEGFDQVSYDTLDDVDHIRLSFDDACVMGLEEKVVRNEDGSVDVEATHAYHAVKFMFNALPADTVSYNLDVLDVNGNIILTRTGEVRLVSPPWEES